MANLFPLMPALKHKLQAKSSHAFSNLKGSVSLDALRHIDVDWQFGTQQVTTTNKGIDLGPYEYELLYRFGLPCKHHLLRAT
jgi:hypothetical protein